MALMDGKKVVVTGAARGLGRVLSHRLLAEGARVAMLSRNGRSVEAAAGDAGDRALPLEVDVSDARAVRVAFERIAETFVTIDLLVNNAAIFDTRRLEAQTVEQLQATVGTNLLGTMYCSKYALPLLRVAGGGDIINISSESARYPAPMLAAYMASKAGVEAFSRGLALDHRAENIRVSVVRLGPLKGTTPTEEVERFIQECIQEGTTWILNPGFDYEGAARAIINMAILPRDVSATVVELRSTTRV